VVMNGLILNNNNFEWLTKTESNMDLAAHFSELYETSFEAFDMFENVPEICEYIPTKYALLDTAYRSYEYHLWDFAHAGHDPELLEDINYWFEEGYDQQDIITMWFQSRTETKGYNFPVPKDSYEGMFIRDTLLGLKMFNLSYLDDGFEGNINATPERIIIDHWVNPPLVRVW
jgi:hypothetical protein